MSRCRLLQSVPSYARPYYCATTRCLYYPRVQRRLLSAASPRLLDPSSGPDVVNLTSHGISAATDNGQPAGPVAMQNQPPIRYTVLSRGSTVEASQLQHNALRQPIRAFSSDHKPTLTSSTKKRSKRSRTTKRRFRKITSARAAPTSARDADKSSSKRIRKIATSSEREGVATEENGSTESEPERPQSIKEALLVNVKPEKKSKAKRNRKENLPIHILSPDELEFAAVPVDIPPVPMLSHGLDRVLFNRGVYRLQDPRSRVYNFDPYLEKIMPVTEFDFDALTEYKTSSQDQDLIAIARSQGSKFTGSTSSMTGVLQHLHYVLSHFRELNHDGLSREFPKPSPNFSKITKGPSAIFLRWKNGMYAIDAEKSYDSPNIMSWLGHSLEKLLTSPRDEFERYRRSNPDGIPEGDDSGKCFHYSTLGNFLMRSQLDARDSRLPGTGVFDLKTRAVVSIRMDHEEYETGAGYQLRYDQGEWESYEREFYDMTRATLLKYSLQVRMGRMDGIFVAYHNIERIFGFQYLSLPDMDKVIHGQADTCLGDQEFKLSIRLLDEILQRAIEKFPETSIRLFVEARETAVPYLYVFAEPVTEEQADTIQNAKHKLRREFERNIIGVRRDDPEVQAEWQDIQDRVDEEVVEDESKGKVGNEEDTNTLTNEANETPVDQTTTEVGTDSSNDTDEGPLVGWTLTVQNRVNGQKVARPENLTTSDNWSIEYHIQEMKKGSDRRIFNMLKDRREKLVGQSAEERSAQLKSFREMIKRYSKKGRAWREDQDKIDDLLGRHIYRPRGPDADEVIRQMGPRLAQEEVEAAEDAGRPREEETSAEEQKSV